MELMERMIAGVDEYISLVDLKFETVPEIISSIERVTKYSTTETLSRILENLKHNWSNDLKIPDNDMDSIRDMINNEIVNLKLHYIKSKPPIMVGVTADEIIEVLNKISTVEGVKLIVVNSLLGRRLETLNILLSDLKLIIMTMRKIIAENNILLEMKGAISSDMVLNREDSLSIYSLKTKIRENALTKHNIRSGALDMFNVETTDVSTVLNTAPLVTILDFLYDDIDKAYNNIVTDQSTLYLIMPFKYLLISTLNEISIAGEAIIEALDKIKTKLPVEDIDIPGE